MSTMPMQRCPHPDCATRISRALYACQPHWLGLPAHIRKEIWDAHRARSLADWLEADKKAKAYWNNFRATVSDF